MHTRNRKTPLSQTLSNERLVRVPRCDTECGWQNGEIQTVDLTHVRHHNQWLISSASYSSWISASCQPHRVTSGWIIHSKFFHTSSVKTLVTTKITSKKVEHRSRYNTELGGVRKKGQQQACLNIFTSHPTTSGHRELSQISKQKKHSDNMHCTVSVDSTEARKCMKSLTLVWFTVTKTVSRVHDLVLIYIARTLQCINQSSGDRGNSVVERPSPRAHCDWNWSRVRFRRRGEN